MERPYTPTLESVTQWHVSMVTDCPVQPDELAYGCNDCFNGLSFADEANDANWPLVDKWQDLGDSGVLCPACREPEVNPADFREWSGEYL